MFGSPKKKMLKTLNEIVVPAGGRIEGLNVKDGAVTFAIAVDPDKAADMEPLRQQAEDAAAALPGVEKATAVLTAERAAAQQQNPQSPVAGGQQQPPEPQTVVVDRIIAVASGKGGVGKSTVAANLAVALARQGQSVGLLDADVYGPSVPTLMGMKNKRPGLNDDNRMIPPEAHGVKLMSMGFLVPEGKAIVWRGAMVHKGLLQMFGNVEWGALDTLIIDMPPGTGDAQLTLAQNVPLSGAVIVSTPQDLALDDARKGIEMFKQVGIPVLGLIENMSVFICPECGHEEDLFGTGGAEAEAKKQKVPFLGKIPLHRTIRTASDSGAPLTASDPDGAFSQAYRAIADKIIASVAVSGAPTAAPAQTKKSACASGTCGCK